MIGVFDSGLGGMLLLDGLLKRYDDREFLFLADRAHAPFGNKSDEELYQIFEENYDLLKKKGCSDLIVACNTLCSTIDFSKYPDIKIHDIIEKTVDSIDIIKNKHILVLATRKTIEKDRYAKLLKAKGYQNITSIALPELAGMVERYASEEEVKNYLFDMTKSVEGVDAIVLACTHYPAYRNVFAALFPAATIYDSNHLSYTFQSLPTAGKLSLCVEKDEALERFLRKHLHASYVYERK